MNEWCYDNSSNQYCIRIYNDWYVVPKQLIEAAVLAEREACAKLVLDDAWALTFQTFGQYRTALAAAIRAARVQEQAEQERMDQSGITSLHLGSNTVPYNQIRASFDRTDR